MTWIMHEVLRAHVETCRPYTLWYPGLVGLAGGAYGTHTAWRLLLAWAVPTLGWVAGHYLGDYYDRRLDAISKPHRPIPSGRLRAGTAAKVGAGLGALAVALAIPANWRAVLLVAAALAGIVVYSRVLKGRGLSGNVIRGVLTALALVVGAMMTAPQPSWRLLPFALVFLVHDTASNLVGTLRDVDGDRDGGYRTSAVRHGVRAAARLAVALYAGAVVVAVLSARALSAYTGAYLALLAVAVVLGTAACVLLLRRTPSPEVALRAHEVLVAERLVLAAAVLAGGAGLWPAVAVLVLALALSVPMQMAMRARYEFSLEGGNPYGRRR
ncbi:UbiA family prenyltransferase [Spirillospora sp. CA-294931]|uniref:UbiA family prenyltransferase n=1 Tax=Spirillospora sp. CA-294931 TaxID=3240042 RepID=UPI003D904937